MTIGRALGEDVISLDETKYISSLFPKKKYETIKEVYDMYGKDSECTQFINEIKKIPNMLEYVMYIEGLVCGKGVHPAGLIILNDDYYKYLPIMKSKGGELVTQHDLHDSEYRGGLKYDLLVLNTLDEIRNCVDLLIANGKIKPGTTLKETYYKYLHPDVLEYDAPEMWNLLHEERVVDIFQFAGNVGAQALKKIKPYSLIQAIVANSLMRISVESGIQPIDRYNQFKNDISLWYKEMRDYGLSEEHIKILEPHLLHLCGVADTQEAAMKLSMDPQISNFTIAQAHKLRKAIAKSYAKDLLEGIKKQFYSSKVDKVLLDYVWEMQFKPMFGYSFSQPHVAAYTIIALQQANLCYRFGEVFWKAAVLTTNASDYSTTAVTLAKLKGFALPPDVNRAEHGFKILEEEQKCLFGFDSIMKIGNDVIDEIIANRPYASFNDFMNRVGYYIGTDKMVNLIKAGCFDSLNPDRRGLMISYFKQIIPEREKLTSANLPFMDKNNLIPKHLLKELDIWKLRKEVKNKNNLYQLTNKTQGYYSIHEDRISKEILQELEDIQILDNNKIGIHSKVIDKYYKDNTVNILEWIASKEAALAFTRFERNELWQKYCIGNTLRWEMNSVNLYYDEHEINAIPLHKYFDIKNFEDLPEEPKVTKSKVVKRGESKTIVEEYEVSVIAGVLINKNKDKKYIELSTPTGSVLVRLGGKYNYYNKSSEGDPSWFERGSILIVVGFRIGDNFIARTYKNSVYKHSLMKVDNYTSKNLKIKMNKKED